MGLLDVKLPQSGFRRPASATAFYEVIRRLVLRRNQVIGSFRSSPSGPGEELLCHRPGHAPPAEARMHASAVNVHEPLRPSLDDGGMDDTGHYSGHPPFEFREHDHVLFVQTLTGEEVRRAVECLFDPTDEEWAL